MSNMENNLQPPQKGERPKAEWGRAVVDSINASRISGGRGVLVSQDQTGTVVQLKRTWPQVRDEEPPPDLFQVRVVPDGEDTVAVSVWLPKQIGGVVRRNGWPVSPQYAPVADEGEWYTIAAEHAVSATEEHVVVRIKYSGPMFAKPTGWEGDLYWELSFEAASTQTVAEIRDKHETPVVLATIKNGALLQQLHVGTIETWYAMPDSEVTIVMPESEVAMPFEYMSFGWRDTLASGSDGHFYELYRFCQLEQIDDLDLSAFYSGSANKDRTLSLVIRTCDDHYNVARIDYAGLDQLFDEYAKDPPSGGEFLNWLGEIIRQGGLDGDCAYANSTLHTCPFVDIVNADPPLSGPLVLTRDPDNGHLEFGAEPGDRWWKQGGGAATCYGSDIADSAKTLAINLDARALVGDWEVGGHPGSFSIYQGTPFFFEGWTVRPADVNINGVTYKLMTLT